MAYYTAVELREQAGGLTASAARAELSHAATTPSASFDIFLSHSIEDEALVLGLRNVLRNLGVTVYVDWLDDPALDRAKVTLKTAVTLRQRMRSSRAMVYATSSNAAASRWMPWELGYFDGRREQSKVAICPITAGAGSIHGQEYLGIYKRVEPVEDNGVVLPSVLKPSGIEGESMRSFVHGHDEFRRVISRRVRADPTQCRARPAQRLPRPALWAEERPPASSLCRMVTEHSLQARLPRLHRERVTAASRLLREIFLIVIARDSAVQVLHSALIVSRPL